MMFYRSLTNLRYKQIYRFVSNDTRQSLIYQKLIGYKNLNKLEHNQKLHRKDATIKKTKLKQRFLQYSRTTIVLYATISLISFKISYEFVAKRVDVEEFFTNLGFSSKTIRKIPEDFGTFLIAYGCHTVLAPVRILLTLILAPIIVRYFKKFGIIKK